MVKITTAARAGSENPSDVLVSVMPNDQGGIKIQLESKKVILKQFGTQIERVIQDKIQEMGVHDIFVIAKDNSALDYTIRARVQTAIERAI